MLVLRHITDLDELLCWRREVIISVFGQTPDSTLLRANEQYYRTHTANGTHLAFVAECDGEDCGCGSVCFTEELPSPDNLTGRCAYLMSIYVRPAFRRRGIARALVIRLIEEAKKRNCGKIYLEASPDGRPVYASTGFKEMPDMMKYYDTDN